jgi:hypothetical protein
MLAAVWNYVWNGVQWISICVGLGISAGIIIRVARFVIKLGE